MLMLALMQVVVQCIIEYEYGTGTVQFVTVFLVICVATAPLYILESSLAPDLLLILVSSPDLSEQVGYNPASTSKIVII